MAEFVDVGDGDVDAADLNTWQDLMTWCANSYYGCVTDVDVAAEVVKEFSLVTHTSYVCTKSSKDFGRFNLSGKHAHFQYYVV
jgi:hypothetical protein